MIQIIISNDNTDKYLIEYCENTLQRKLLATTKMIATHSTASRDYIVIAFENSDKTKIMECVQETLSGMYLTEVKRQYFKNQLGTAKINPLYKKLLIDSFVAFDRIEDEKLLSGMLSITSCINIDGFIAFRLRELRSRWSEVVKITEQNLMYLSNEETILELIRYLISSINPKLNSVEVNFDESFVIQDKFGSSKILCTDENNLLLNLIDIAPLEIDVNCQIEPRITSLIEELFMSKSVYF